MKNEIILYLSNELPAHLEVRFEKETIWLTQKQMSILFGKDADTVSLHLKNIFFEKELDENSTTEHFSVVQKEGNRYVSRRMKYYNLDAILSVGYRVNSKRGTQFRIWANQVLKDYLLKGYALNNRMNRLEDHLESLNDKVQQIDLQIQSKLFPTQGIFFEGQVFDAYELTSRIIRSAKQSIVLIDNYIDESTLLHLTKKEKNVAVSLLSKSKSFQLDLDLEKANEQYGNYEWKEFNKSHDRFLIIDHSAVYHIGASLKDLGKKWFAFSKLDERSMESLLNSILEVIKTPDA
ncbi:MAG: virulence RhuM family protein [Flavobacteriia bacterium]|jgi:hypothetical protein